MEFAVLFTLLSISQVLPLESLGLIGLCVLELSLVHDAWEPEGGTQFCGSIFLLE